MKYSKGEIVSIKAEPSLSEKWVQQIIADDPQILGLGDLILKDSERTQPRGGRLDLLLQDAETNSRFEVEIQLGRVDESHIIRAIEYWDVERKRYPQYEHTAVIIAEDITGRFLNVISLFNGAIPLVAIQMSAIQVGDAVTLAFTKVLDQTVLGLVDEDEEVSEVTDRAYWKKRATDKTLKAADEVVEILQEIDSELEPKYNKFYIGLFKNGSPNNFVLIRPRKNHVQLAIRLPKSESTETKIEETDLDLIDYSQKSGRYRVRVKPGEIAGYRDLLKLLFSESHSNSGA
ncbi:hypothetical protein N9251_01090 [Gammaproteobacteria bacterium]|nr:hypothetical protein [Gammaproteobacteria bacterium]